MLNALLLMQVITLILMMFGFKRCQQLMGYFIPGVSVYAKSCDYEKERIRVIYRMVNIVVRYGPYSANCLRYSLVVWWLLARSGVESEIHP